jgi:ATP-dependent helicase YprA (DUF1998 family)
MRRLRSCDGWAWQRRKIELAFRSGELLGMIATNALELGPF